MRSNPRWSFRTVVSLLGVALFGIAMAAWWWPGLTGQDSQTDVHLVSSESESGAKDAIDRRLREEGFTTEWSSVGIEGCVVPNPDGTDWEVLVVLVPSQKSCLLSELLAPFERLISKHPSHRIVAVIPWTDWTVGERMIDDLRALGVAIVDPRKLIGRGGMSQVCLWWDDCDSSGRVTTVDGSGLTSAGHQRLARSIVAGVL